MVNEVVAVYGAKDINKVEEVVMVEMGGLDGDLSRVNIDLLLVGVLLGSDVNIEE